MSDTVKLNSKCPCTYSCARHGNCKECRAFHAASGSKTGCQRKAAEAKAEKK